MPAAHAAALAEESESRHYPGEAATPDAIIKLADEYRKAAELLRSSGRKGAPISRAPFRLVAIHAIELYLNAYLMHLGYGPTNVRGLQHDLRKRAEMAEAAGLKLRARTFQHLLTLAESREYLVSRYGPELISTASRINRLEATLSEVAGKVTQRLAAPSVPAPHAAIA